MGGWSKGKLHHGAHAPVHLVRGFGDLLGDPVDDRIWVGGEAPLEARSVKLELVPVPLVDEVIHADRGFRDRALDRRRPANSVRDL